MAVNFNIFFSRSLTILNKFTKLLEKFPIIFLEGRRGAWFKVFKNVGGSRTTVCRSLLQSANVCFRSLYARIRYASGQAYARVGLDTTETKKSSSPFRKWNSGHSILNRSFTDWATGSPVFYRIDQSPLPLPV